MIDQAQRLRELSFCRVENKNIPKIISVTSGKGGTGKTLISFFLSKNLAAKGYKVLLVELDFNLSNLSVILNFEPGKTLFHFLNGRSLLKEVVTTYAQNFDIIFGDSGRMNYPENVNSRLENLLFTALQRSIDYDYVILDNGAGIAKEVLTSLSFSNLNLIVATPEATSMMDAYVIIKMIFKSSFSVKNGIIINKCFSTEEGIEANSNLNKAASHFFNLNVDLLGIVKENKDLQIALRSRNLPLENWNITDFKSSINDIAERLIVFPQLANINQSVK